MLNQTTDLGPNDIGPIGSRFYPMCRWCWATDLKGYQLYGVIFHERWQLNSLPAYINFLIQVILQEILANLYTRILDGFFEYQK